MGRLPFRYCLLACIAAFPATAAQASCWQAQEAKAAQLRSLDALLKVGAQRCGASDAAFAERYDAFASQHRATLDTQDLVLKARFMREAGIAGGRQAYDDFAAVLAESQSARLADAGLCSTIGDLTSLAAEGSAADLETLATSFAADVVVADKLCDAKTIAAAAPAEALPEVQSGIPAGEPAKAAPSQQEALAQAAAALQSATAALQAAQAQRAAGPKLVSAESEEPAAEPPAIDEAEPPRYVPN